MRGRTLCLSGVTSSLGEQCLVSSSAGVSLEPCLAAIAAGDGREVMQFDKAVACTVGHTARPPKGSLDCQVGLHATFGEKRGFALVLRTLCTCMSVGDGPRGPMQRLLCCFWQGWANCERSGQHVPDLV